MELEDLKNSKFHIRNKSRNRLTYILVTTLLILFILVIGTLLYFLFSDNNPYSNEPIIVEPVEKDVIEKIDSIVVDENKYYYLQLNENQRKTYKKLYEASCKFEYKFEPYENTTGEDLQKVIIAFGYDYPEFFWTGAYGYEYTYDENGVIDVTFQIEDEEIETLESTYYEILDYINSYVEKIENSSDYIMIRKVHDLICEEISYDKDSTFNQDLRSVLRHGKTVCTGYAKLFEMITQNMGYNSTLIYGTADNGEEIESHAWNMIYYDDTWKYVDVTWDDTDDYRILVYDYFMKDTLDDTHFPDEGLFNFTNY